MASAAANFAKKMQALRVEADEHQAKREELQARVKTLEQEALAKEQEITSLTHRNQLLEGEVEKLETGLKEAKDAAGQSAQHGQQNESLQRRMQLLEEEAEEADKTLRETNDKYEMTRILCKILRITIQAFSPRGGRGLTFSHPQTPPDRCQGRPLRTQSAGAGGGT